MLSLEIGQAGLSEIKRLPVRVMLPHLQSPIQQPLLPYKQDGSLVTLGPSPSPPLLLYLWSVSLRCV